MSRLIALVMLLVSMGMVLACSDDGASATLPPTATPIPTGTPQATSQPATPIATAQATPSRPPNSTPTVAVAAVDGETTSAETRLSSCQLVQGGPGQPGEVPLHVEVIVEALEIPWGLAILP